jgi:hypothetical protein
VKVSGYLSGDNQGFFTTVSFASPGGNTPAFNWDNGFPQDFNHPPFIDPTLMNGESGATIANGPLRPGTVHNWNFDIQRQLKKDLLFDVGYVGAKGDHLQAALYFPNQINSKYLSKGGCLGVDITQQTSDPQCSGQASVPLPYASFTGTVGQALRPFPQTGDFGWNSFDPEPLGFYTYDAMQAKLEKRFSQGLTFLVSYVVSKNLTNADSDFPAAAGWVTNTNGVASGQDSYNRKIEKGLSQLDIPQALVLSYTYDLPVGPGKKFLKSGGAIGKVTGGWHLAGVHQYKSGYPTSVIASAGYVGLFTTSGIRANEISGVAQKGWTGKFDPAIDSYFNSAAFATPAPYTFGNAPRALNLRTFPNLNEDFSLGKRTTISERVNLDFKVEAFDIFNRHVFGQPAGDVSNPSTFGLISSASNPRRMQFSLKLNF